MEESSVEAPKAAAQKPNVAANNAVRATFHAMRIFGRFIRTPYFFISLTITSATALPEVMPQPTLAPGAESSP